MYRSNLSWKSVQTVLNGMLEQGLICETVSSSKGKRARKIYRVTAKGDNVISYYQQAKELIDLNFMVPNLSD